MSNLANIVRALLISVFDVRSFEAKLGCSMNMFEFVRCSKNNVRVGLMFDEMVFDTSLILCRTFVNFIFIGCREHY